MNAIHLISPYKNRGMWVFDDPAVGLKREPFVAGADTVIDFATQSIPDAERGFNLLFSSNRFPSAQIRLDLSEPGDDKIGNTYFCKEFNLTAWLCPALYRYFSEAPANIYAEFRPMDGRTTNTYGKSKSKNKKQTG